jgi:hypothetical protein
MSSTTVAGSGATSAYVVPIRSSSVDQSPALLMYAYAAAPTSWLVFTARTRVVGRWQIGLQALTAGAAYNLLRLARLRPAT